VRYGGHKEANAHTDHVCIEHAEIATDCALALLVPELRVEIAHIMVGYSGGVCVATTVATIFPDLGYNIRGLIADAEVPRHHNNVRIPALLFYKADDFCWDGRSILESWKGKLEPDSWYCYYNCQHAKFVSAKQIRECIANWHS